jgi:hypothetical protein
MGGHAQGLFGVGMFENGAIYFAAPKRSQTFTQKIKKVKKIHRIDKFTTIFN